MNNYNLPILPTTGGLKNWEMMGTDYLTVLDAPDNAGILIRLNDASNPPIPLAKNGAIYAKDTSRIYVTCNDINGGSILLGQAKNKEDLKIEVVPSLEFSNKVLNNLQFAPNGNTTKVTILPATSYSHDISLLDGIRFTSTEEIGVELDSSGEKYPMLEEEIFTRNLSENIVFHNDNVSSIDLIILDM